MRRVALGLALTFALAAGTLASAGCGSSTSASSEGESLVLAKCVRCHTIDRVRNKKDADRAAWTTTVERMQSKNGLVLTPDEKTKIIDFLASGQPY